MAIVIIRLIIIIIDTKQYDNMILVPFGEPLGASVGVLDGVLGSPKEGVRGGLGWSWGSLWGVRDRLGAILDDIFLLILFDTILMLINSRSS